MKPGHRDRYETWLRQIIAAAAQFSGHQGVHVVRPPEGHDTFEIAVRFSHPDEADAWLNSDVRRELVSDIVPALASKEQVEIQTGIDYWFTPPTSKAKQPTRWKQWLITTTVIWPLTLIVPIVFQPLFDRLPVLALWFGGGHCRRTSGLFGHAPSGSTRCQLAISLVDRSRKQMP